MSHQRLPSKSLKLAMQRLIKNSHHSPEACDSIKQYVFGMTIDRKAKKKEQAWQGYQGDEGILVFENQTFGKASTKKFQQPASFYKQQSLQESLSNSKINITVPELNLIEQKAKHLSKKNRTEPSQLHMTAVLKSHPLTSKDIQSQHKSIERTNTFLFSSPTKQLPLHPSLPRLKEDNVDQTATMLTNLNKIQGSKFYKAANFRLDRDKLSKALIHKFGFEHFTEYYNLEPSEHFAEIASVLKGFLYGTTKQQLKFIFSTYDLNKDGMICESDVWNIINVGNEAVLSDMAVIGDFMKKNRIGSKMKFEKDEKDSSHQQKLAKVERVSKSRFSKNKKIHRFFATTVLRQFQEKPPNKTQDTSPKHFRISFELFRLIFSDRPSSLLAQLITFFTNPAQNSRDESALAQSAKPSQRQPSRIAQVRKSIHYLSEARKQRKYLKGCIVKI